jgi:hypothetical protein
LTSDELSNCGCRFKARLLQLYYLRVGTLTVEQQLASRECIDNIQHGPFFLFNLFSSQQMSLYCWKGQGAMIPFLAVPILELCRNMGTASTLHADVVTVSPSF